ncbi:HpcH/HpaI aldolase/citrate lyase family protein, partial [Streptomyces sp. CO7]
MQAPPLTLLYVPGDRPEVVAKALRAGADVVLVDLEDAVAPARKEYARDATAELLAEQPPVPVHVRVNCPSSPEGRADLKTLLPCQGLGGVRLPKVTSPDTVARVAGQASALDRTGLPLFPLLESALGVEEAFRIARADPSVGGVSLGEADLRADLGVREDAGLDWCRSRVVVAARAAGLRPPAQSVHPDVRDLEGLRAG